MNSTQLPENSQLQPEEKKAPPTYVKLAMRNMVRKGGTSLKHFLLTSIALITFLIGVSYLTR